MWLGKANQRKSILILYTHHPARSRQETAAGKVCFYPPPGHFLLHALLQNTPARPGGFGANLYTRAALQDTGLPNHSTPPIVKSQ